MGPGVLSPRGCHLFFQSINAAAFSSSAEYVLASCPVIWMFFCSISTGSMSSLAARSSSADMVIRHICGRSEEHTSELQSRLHLVCRLLLEKKKIDKYTLHTH